METDQTADATKNATVDDKMDGSRVNDDEADEDVLLLSDNDRQKSSQSSTNSVQVTIGNIIRPSVLNPSTDSGNKATTAEGDGNETERSRSSSKSNRKKKNISGAEKKRRRKAKLLAASSADGVPKNAENNKRARSPATGEGTTPPQKRTLNKTPPANQQTASYKEVAQQSLTYVIVGANGVTLNADQVQMVMGNIVYELEQFIGTAVKAPSFNGNRLGECELELECADHRSMTWLKKIVPNMKPWRNAALSVMTKAEWELINRPRKMYRMSVVVPWRTTGEYFLDVLRSHNPELRTRYWEIKNVQDRGASMKFNLKVDDISAGLLQSRNYRAHWLLDVIHFRMDRGKNPGTSERNEHTETSGGEKNATRADGTSGADKNSEAGGSTDRANEAEPEKESGAPETKVNAPTETEGAPNTPRFFRAFGRSSERTPTFSKRGTRGASQIGNKTKTGTSKTATENSKVINPADGSIKLSELHQTGESTQ